MAKRYLVGRMIHTDSSPNGVFTAFPDKGCIGFMPVYRTKALAKIAATRFLPDKNGKKVMDEITQLEVPYERRRY